MSCSEAAEFAESLQSLQPSPTVQRYVVNRLLGDSKLPVGLKVSVNDC